MLTSPSALTTSSYRSIPHELSEVTVRESLTPEIPIPLDPPMVGLGLFPGPRNSNNLNSKQFELGDTLTLQQQRQSYSSNLSQTSQPSNTNSQRQSQQFNHFAQTQQNQSQNFTNSNTMSEQYRRNQENEDHFGLSSNFQQNRGSNLGLGNENLRKLQELYNEDDDHRSDNSDESNSKSRSKDSSRSSSRSRRYNRRGRRRARNRSRDQRESGSEDHRSKSSKSSNSDSEDSLRGSSKSKSSSRSRSRSSNTSTESDEGRRTYNNNNVSNDFKFEKHDHKTQQQLQRDNVLLNLQFNSKSLGLNEKNAHSSTATLSTDVQDSGGTRRLSRISGGSGITIDSHHSSGGLSVGGIDLGQLSQFTSPGLSNQSQNRYLNNLSNQGSPLIVSNQVQNQILQGQNVTPRSHISSNVASYNHTINNGIGNISDPNISSNTSESVISRPVSSSISTNHTLNMTNDLQNFGNLASTDVLFTKTGSGTSDKNSTVVQFPISSQKPTTTTNSGKDKRSSSNKNGKNNSSKSKKGFAKTVLNWFKSGSSSSTKDNATVGPGLENHNISTISSLSDRPSTSGSNNSSVNHVNFKFSTRPGIGSSSGTKHSVNKISQEIFTPTDEFEHYQNQIHTSTNLNTESSPNNQHYQRRVGTPV